MVEARNPNSWESLVKSRSIDLAALPRRLDSYTGVAFAGGLFLRYTAQADLHGENLYEVIGQLAPENQLPQVCELFQIEHVLDTASSLLEFSRTQISLQTDPHTLHPVDPIAAGQFFATYEFPGEEIALHYQENLPGTLHGEAVRNLFMLRDFSNVVATVIRTSEVDFPAAELASILDLEHLLRGIYSCYSIGVYLFEEKHLQLEAHLKFMNAYEGIIRNSRGIYELIHNKYIEQFPDEFSELVKSITGVSSHIHTELSIDDFKLAPETKIPFLNILSNLVNNALKFSAHPAAQEILANTIPGWRPEPVQVAISLKTDNNLEISVSDNGIPISESLREQLLTKGHHLHNLNPGIPSTGQGLPTILATVESLGGSVQIIDSTAPYTKTFVVTVPLNNLVRV